MRNNGNIYILSREEWTCIINSSCSVMYEKPDCLWQLSQLMCEGNVVTREDGRVLGYDPDTDKFYDTFQYAWKKKKRHVISHRIDRFLLNATVVLVSYSILKDLVIYVLWHFAPEEFRFGVGDLPAPPTFLFWK